MERRLAAILAADVVDYSRLMGEDQARTLDALRQLRGELFEPVVSEHKGTVVKRMGDGWIVEFPSVSDAVDCAIRIHEGLAEHEIIRLRTGIHIGDVVFENEDVFGEGVNVAARLEELANPGEVLISDTAQQSLDGKAAAKFSDGSSHQLKNIARPVQVWRWPVVSSADAVSTMASEDVPLALPDKPSIAVLPFDNMSGDPEQEYFSDGITEDIITALSKFRSFFVIARNSTFTYKGKAVNIAKVGRELGVRYVVEGSVRKAGDRIRVTAQLIEAASDNHVWAERYDRDVTDIFELQDEITETIVGAVEQEIGSSERTRATHMRPENLQSWDLLQRGLFHVWQMNRDGLATGADLLRQSVEKDPSFAEAHAYLAFTYLHQVFLGTVDDMQYALSEATTHTREAIKYDDHSSLGHEMSARLLCFEKRFDEAIAAAKRAVQCNPNSSSAHFALGVVCFFADRHDEALAPIDRAIRLSPKDHRRFTHLNTKAGVLGELGRLEEAINLGREAASLQHGDFRVFMLLARNCAEAGLMDEAGRAAERALELNPNFTLRGFAASFHPDFMARFVKHIAPLGFLSRV